LKKEKENVRSPEVYWAGQCNKIKVFTTVSRPGASSGGTGANKIKISGLLAAQRPPPRDVCLTPAS